MPQSPKKITEKFEQILKKRITKDLQNLDQTPGDKQVIGTNIKNEIISQMRTELKNLLKKNEISIEHFKSGNNALDFYDKHVSVLSFNPNPYQALSELTAIDYSEEVKIQRIKPKTILTQMQPAYLEGQERVGNFYTIGSLPSDFNDRANKSGIGIYGVEKDKTISEKSVYISKVEKECIALQSTSAASCDNWSVTGQNQMSQGGGIQLRMSTDDYGKIVRIQYGEVQARERYSTREKTLKNGYLQEKRKNFTIKLNEEKNNKKCKSRNIG